MPCGALLRIRLVGLANFLNIWSSANGLAVTAVAATAAGSAAAA
eukprot:CAMPEP_0177151718 /NCGR_PEP_ID=MMETSP0367-20130122/89_1 /TAXON_ID=447022 ORGANISM="Scrippsiella hangoei-like, Strain SHHI-4" /NCGR_SAMPLE_ID=MMETSP0367 /ASSEMBLY_ACC=CAM_ASM_000362 /LENGTH=43 /DNA_ID= /DNA_START= /DNA_END= /DNA_ORIENTATION=